MLVCQVMQYAEAHPDDSDSERKETIEDDAAIEKQRKNEKKRTTIK